jgi:outer membrane phospholipase A
MNFDVRRYWRVVREFILLGLGLAVIATAPAQEAVLTFNAEDTTVVAGTPESIWLNVLNPASQTATWSFPQTIEVRIIGSVATVTNTLTFQASNALAEVTLAPGTFARREYSLLLPESVVGRVTLEFPGMPADRLGLEVQSPLAAGVAPRKRSRFTRIFKYAEPVEAGKPFDAGRFFEQQISAHEPMYFIAGDKSPNAKFQLSFKYQFLNETSPHATNYPALKGVKLAYTQTSLWDLSSPSAPFFDTSYKPALLYNWDRVVGGKERDHFRLDLQGGLQHESNGKGGVDSRSMNMIYLRPTLVFGRDDSFQLTLQPRVWGYIGGLSDNRDLDEYRGYFDLRAVVGWRRGLQLAALGRMGHEGNHTSLQLDLTYPTMQLFSSFSVYLQAQYFTGYGESLLLYNQRTDVFRVGFALYR